MAMAPAPCNGGGSITETPNLRLLNADVSATERWHVGPITGLSMVGTRLFSAGQDKRILSFEHLPHGPLRFVGPELNATAPILDMQAAWSKDPTKIIVAAACQDSQLRVWLSPRTCSEGGDQQSINRVDEHVLCGHTDSIRSVDIQLSFVLSASSDATARVWDLQAGREILTMGHPNSVVRGFFFPESTLLVTACTNHTTCMWDLRMSSDRPTYVIREPVDAAEVGGLAVGAAGLLASADGQGQVRLFDVPRCGVRCQSQFKLPTIVPAMQFIFDNRYLACAGRDGDLYAVRLMDLAAQAFEVQQESKTPIMLMRKAELKSRNLLVYAFDKEDWGFGLLDEAPKEEDVDTLAIKTAGKLSRNIADVRTEDYASSHQIPQNS